MKNLILIFFAFISLTITRQVKLQNTNKISKNNQKALDLEIPSGNPSIVYPIQSSKVSATPISIPAPNNRPIKLTPVAKGMTIFSGNINTSITSCSLLSFKNNKLLIRISYTIQTINNNSIYAGAWFYDKNDNTAEVGYVPQKVIQRPSGTIEVTLKFNKFPVTTEYLKVLLLQDGKEIAKKDFKASYLWTNSNQKFVTANDKVAEIIDVDKIQLAAPDLEITAIKVISQNGVVPFSNNCKQKEKIIFISNIGSETSSPFILSVGYTKYYGNRGRYQEVKRISMPTLLPGKQTSRIVIMPAEANNIKADIILNYNTNGEFNTSNNSMELRCTTIN